MGGGGVVQGNRGAVQEQPKGGSKAVLERLMSGTKALQRCPRVGLGKGLEEA